MRLLVTGGAGYLGSEVCRLAEERGHDVLATQLEHEPPHGRALRVDLRDEAATARAVLRSGPELVIHTAYRQNDEEVWDAVVKATRNVAQEAHRAGARLFHLSSDLVFDGEHAPYVEDDEPHPVSLYGSAKANAERLVRELHPAATIVRTSLLYGHPTRLGPQERLALAAEIAFYTDEIRCPTRVPELAAALLELAERNDAPPLLHVAGADALSRYDFARLLRAAHGHDADAVQATQSPGVGRARNVALDTSRARALLRTRLRGATEALHFR